MIGTNPSPTPVGDASKRVASKLASSPAPGPVEVAPIDRLLLSMAATIDRKIGRLSPVRSNCWKQGKAMTPEPVGTHGATVGEHRLEGGGGLGSLDLGVRTKVRPYATREGTTEREVVRIDLSQTQTAPRSEAESGARLGSPVRGGASKPSSGT